MPPKHCDLAAHYGPLAASLPHGRESGPNFLFDKSTVPAPPRSMSTAQILIRKGHKSYNNWCRVDCVWMFLNAETCRQLGVFLIACGLHGPPSQVTLRFAHPKSDIRQIIVRQGTQHREDPAFAYS